MLSCLINICISPQPWQCSIRRGGTLLNIRISWHQMPKIGKMYRETLTYRSANLNNLGFLRLTLIQSSLLRCRWATVSLIRQTEKKWLHKVAPKLTANPIEGVVNSRHHSSTFELEQYTHARYTTSQKVTSYDSEYNHFEADYAEFLHLTQLGESGEEIMFIRPPFRWETPLGIHPQTEIPESLLRGPWSPDMVMYLFWLTRAGVSIDYSASTSGEVCPGCIIYFNAY